MDKKYPSQESPRITAIVPKSLKTWVKRYAKKNHMSVSQVVIQLLKELRIREK